MAPRLILFGLLLGPIPGLALAVDLFDGRAQIHGFASQAAIQTSANHYYGNSDETSFELTEIGLNASFELSPKWLGSVQALSRRAGAMYDGAPSLDYALIEHTPISNARHRIGVRLGRIKSPVGLYNETRDVPFTRPGIFLPQVIYFDNVRNLLLSYDGLLLYGDLYQEGSSLSLSAGIGRSVIDDNVEWVFLSNDQHGDLYPDGINWGLGRLWLTTFNETLEMGLSGIITEMTLDAETGSPLSSGTIDVFHWIASLRYNAADWTLSAEYAQTPLKWNDLGPAFPFEKQVMEGYYLQGTYRLMPTLEIMARYEEGFRDKGDRSGREKVDLTGGRDPRYIFFAKILSLGLRWNVQPHTMLRLEYQHHDGNLALSWRENPDRGNRVREWDVFAASLSIRF